MDESWRRDGVRVVYPGRMTKSFSDPKIKTKSDDYHGLANYERTQPDVAAQGVKSINIELTFEMALRLSLAIESPSCS